MHQEEKAPSHIADGKIYMFINTASIQAFFFIIVVIAHTQGAIAGTSVYGCEIHPCVLFLSESAPVNHGLEGTRLTVST